MTRVLLICVCLLSSVGCVAPQVHTSQVVYGMSEKTILLDSETRREIKGAQIVIILAQGQAYLPDGGQGPPKRPKVVVDEFARIDKLTYTDRELYVWPFFASGTLTQGCEVFVYKHGYRPVAFKPTGQPMKYPAIIEMVAAAPDDSKQMMIGVAVEKIPNDEWKNYARHVLDRSLD